jgi:hypothetical protein
MLTRSCGKCRRDRPLRDFDFGDGELRALCRKCSSEDDRGRRSARIEQIEALERQRRTLIAALVKIDAEIAELRGRSSSTSFELVESDDVFGDPEGEGTGDLGLD